MGNDAVQSNFSGGEFSSAYAARIDDEDYKKALALCLNYIPGQEGSLRPRSGFKYCGNTKNNDPAKLLPFRFAYTDPYVAEFTDSNLRLWSNGLPVLETSHAIIQSCSGDPPTFVLRVTAPTNATGIPTGWEDGDSVLIGAIDSGGFRLDIGGIVAAPYLYNREFTLTIVDPVAGTIRLTDAVTGIPLAGAISFGGVKPSVFKILDLETPYQQPEGVRQIAFSGQKVSSVLGTTAFDISPPDHRVTYLYPAVSPRSLSYSNKFIPTIPPIVYDTTRLARRNVELLVEDFIDGPYLDAASSTTPLVVDGTTGVIKINLHSWDARIIYMRGEIALDYTQDPNNDPYYYLSLVDNNVGNALPATSTPGSVDANWLQLNVQRHTWKNSTTYDIGFATTAAFYSGAAVPINELPVYYSKTASNINNPPATSPLDWGTTPPAWDALATYAATAIVKDAGVIYVAVSIPVVGTAPAAAPAVWIVLPDLTTAITTITDIQTGWLSQQLFYVDDAGGDGTTLAIHFGTNNPGRLIRLKWGPQPYSAKITYAVDDLVNFKDIIYKSLMASNIGNLPDTDAVNWEIQTTSISWTWGRVTESDEHQYQARIEILGPDLPSNTPVWELRMGVFSDTTGWPTCGVYHEGRLWLAGPLPNRLDGGCPDQGFNFAPTAPDGTVSDGNAISLTFNTEKVETVQALSSIAEGVLVLTTEGERLVSASALNDPLTPTSVQQRKTSGISAVANEAERLPSALAVIQNGGRRLFEYRTFVDMSSYQSRLSAHDLTRKCQHLTAGGMGQIQYQSLTQPIIWVCPASQVTISWEPATKHVCALAISKPVLTTLERSSGLFGIGYLREPGLNYSAPFSFEHGQEYVTGLAQAVTSIAVQRDWLAGNDVLYAAVNGPDNFYRVQQMAPLFESDPLETKYDGSGNVVSYGTKASSYFLDNGVTPVGCQVATNGLSVTFYGLWPHAGNTVSFTIMGKYVGDFLIGADGSVNVPFSAVFTMQDVGDAANFWPVKISDTGFTHDGRNETVSPAYINGFTLDANGHSITSNGYIGFFGQFGYKFRRRGQTLRPATDGQGAVSFAKLGRNYRMGVFVDAAHEIRIGSDFVKMQPLALTLGGPKNNTPVGVAGLTTGIFRDSIKSEYDFDGVFCWEQTEPWPGGILAVGGFSNQEPG